MKEVWVHSMNGFPWTKNKMAKAVEILRPNATITFAFGYEKLSLLKDLNELVFKVRPDLVLSVYSITDKRFITEEELEYLHKMNYVKNLSLHGFSNKFLDISKMTQLTSLTLVPNNKLDISFLSNLQLLEKITFTGKFSSLDPIKNCRELKEIYLRTTINSFDFFKNLNKIEEIIIDSCVAPSDFEPLNKPSLQKLTIASVKMLEQVDSLANFTNLHSLDLDAPQLKRLPKMNKLFMLKKLKLANMKKWENPETLEALPFLEELKLEEINTKLKAEQFYFLTKMKTLKVVDFRFIDFNKGRIEKLNNYFNLNGKDDILKID